MININKPNTLVVFRTDKQGQVIALFPQISTEIGMCKSFSSGEFGSAPYGIVYCNTHCATPEEYSSAQGELEAIGYSLKIQRRKSA